MYDPLYGWSAYGGSGLSGWPHGPYAGVYPTVDGKEPETVKEPKPGIVSTQAVASLRNHPLAVVSFGDSWMLWGGGEKFTAPPRYSYLTDCLMDRDPTLARCRAHYEGRIKSSLWTYTKRKDDVPDEWVESVRETFDALRSKIISEALRCLSNGHRPFEKVWDREDGKLTLIDCIGYEPIGLQILKYKDTGAFAGITAGTVDQRLPPNKSFVVRVNGQGGNFHGIGYHVAAYDPWCDKNRARWDRIGIGRKLSGIIPKIKYPPGMSNVAGVEVSNATVATQMLSELGLGHGVAVPSIPVETQGASTEEIVALAGATFWQLDFYDAGNLAPATMGIIGAQEYDDKQLCRAWRVSERAIIEATTSGSRADSESHQDDDTLQLEHIDDLIAEQVSEGAVDDYLEFNFSREARGMVRIEPAPLHAEKKINARAIVSMMLSDQAFGPRLAKVIDVDQVVEDAGYKVTETKWADTEPPPIDPVTGMPMDGTGAADPTVDEDGWEPQPEDDDYVPMNGNGQGVALSRAALALSGCGSGAGGFQPGNKCQKPGQGGGAAAGLVKGKAIAPAPRQGAAPAAQTAQQIQVGTDPKTKAAQENTQRQQRIAQQHAGEAPHEKWRRRSDSHVANIHAADGAVDNAPTTGGVAGLSDKVEDYAEDTGGELVDAHRDGTDHKIGLRTGKGHDERFEAVHLNGDVYAWRDGGSGYEGIGKSSDMAAAYNTAREGGAIALSAHLAGKTEEHEAKDTERQAAKAERKKGRTPVSGAGLSMSRAGGRFADVLDWLGRMTGDEPEPSRGLSLGGSDNCNWKTINGTHVCINGAGNVVKGPATLKVEPKNHEEHHAAIGHHRAEAERLVDESVAAEDDDPKQGAKLLKQATAHHERAMDLASRLEKMGEHEKKSKAPPTREELTHAAIEEAHAVLKEEAPKFGAAGRGNAGGYVPIGRVRQRIAEKYGAAAAGDALDMAILHGNKDQKLRVIESTSPSHAMFGDTEWGRTNWHESGIKISGGHRPRTLVYFSMEETPAPAKVGRTPVSGAGISASVDHGLALGGGNCGDGAGGFQQENTCAKGGNGEAPGLMLGGDGDDCDWKTIHGAHVCIKGGKIVEGPAHLKGKMQDDARAQGHGKPGGRHPQEKEAWAAAKESHAKIAAETKRLGSIVKVPDVVDAMRESVPNLSAEDARGMLLRWHREGRAHLQIANDSRLEPRAAEGIEAERGGNKGVALHHYIASMNGEPPPSGSKDPDSLSVGEKATHPVLGEVTIDAVGSDGKVSIRYVENGKERVTKRVDSGVLSRTGLMLGGDNCGTGAGGFQSGNTCAGGSNGGTAVKSAGMKLHKSLTVNEEARKQFAETGSGAFRIQHLGKPLPEKSADMWTGDEGKTMAGTSGYANLSNAIEDILFGRAESATGENYSENVRGSKGEPGIVVLTGKKLDGPGAEVVVPNAKVAAVFTEADFLPVFREEAKKVFAESGIADTSDVDSMTPRELLESYDLDRKDLSRISAAVENNLLASIKKP